MFNIPFLSRPRNSFSTFLTINNIIVFISLNNKVIVATDPVRLDWTLFQNIPDDVLEKNFLPNYLELNNDALNVSLECRNDLNFVRSEFKQRKAWAFKMLSTWPKLIPSGLLSGTQTDYGDYDLCMSIEQLQPQHCLMDVKFPMPPRPRFHSLCQRYSVDHSPQSDPSNDSHSCNRIDPNATIYEYLAHTIYDQFATDIKSDGFFIRDKFLSIGLQPLFKAHYSVETFFFISGLLTSYVTLRYSKGNFKNFNLFGYLVLRYLRLTPQMISFLFMLILLPPMFDGPLWSIYIDQFIQKCERNWWKNFIYAQNVWDTANIVSHILFFLGSEKLISDMQLHWISIILVIAMLLNRPRGILLTKIFVVICFCIMSATIIFKNFPPGHIMTARTNFLDEYGKPSEFIRFFFLPWVHGPVFFVGFLFGIYLYSKNVKTIQISETTKYLCWLLTLLLYLFCMYNTSPWLTGMPYNRFWSAFLFPFNRTLWGIILSMVIWLCITGNGFFVGHFLSLKVFRPLSRMTYSVYLSHVFVIFVRVGTSRQLMDIGTISMTFILTSTIVLSYLLGFLFTIIVESPLIQMLEFLKDDLLKRRFHSIEKLSKTSSRNERLPEMATIIRKDDV
ncbi:Acyltransferase-like protein 3 [Sarcoptes scabiei]|uniref:Acyltransferase-like protein 3 n=1 Tax=Sarcoptes scabiei TaxID=52283 RepID=A0A132AA36_SARSC|nr:Acyltransferase-like protein 3 [Sarcoptes scabiei]